jgi:glycosyltransferase involved in cell wall biosynthesis
VTPPRVCHLTSVHDPLDDRIFLRECRTLAGAGYDVCIIGPAPCDHVADGVRIVAIPEPEGRFERMTRTTPAVLLAALREDADIYHLHDPELVPAGLVLRARGKRVIYDVHEDVPADILAKPWIPRGLRPPVAWSFARLAQVAARASTAVVAATPAIARRFPPRKTAVVRNYPIVGELTAPSPVPFAQRPPHMLYHGSITYGRGIFGMIAALREPVFPRDGKLVLAGRFESEALEAAARRSTGWERVDFLGWRARAELPAILGSARLGLLLLHPEPNYVESLPVKLWEYMAAGLPVLASDFPLWREIITSAGCGRVVDPFDTAAIAAAMTELLEHPAQSEEMGRRGREAVLARYNWSTQTPELLRVYEEAC